MILKLKLIYSILYLICNKCNESQKIFLFHARVMRNLVLLTEEHYKEDALMFFQDELTNEPYSLTSCSPITFKGLESKKETSIPLSEPVVHILALDSEFTIFTENSVYKDKGTLEHLGTFDAKVRKVEYNLEFCLVLTSKLSLLCDFEVLKEFEIDCLDFSWRPDGEYFCVIGRNKFSVFTKSGQLFSSSTEFDARNVSWKSSGELIAAYTDKLIFIEKNSLQHGELVVGSVESVEWNSDSFLMALKHEDCIKIYYRSNYKWQEKFCIPSKGSVHFDNVNPYKLFLVDSKVSCYSFDFLINEFDGLCAVFDKGVQFTNFRKQIIPPPMYAFRIECQPVHIAFNEASFAILERRRIFLATEQNHSASDQLHQTNPEFLFSEKFSCRQVLINGLCFVLAHDLELGADVLFQFDHDLSLLFECVLDFKAMLLFSSGGDCMIEACDGRVFGVNCDQISHIRQIPISSNVKSCAFTLSLQKRVLFKDEQIFEPNVTSFTLSGDFLLVTLITHTLKIYNLNLDQLEERKIERGALLVSAFDDYCILQMPRGNIEIIRPRCMVRRTLDSMLEKKKYLDAFLLVRKHRLDLDLLVDAEWDCEAFIQQVERTDYLNLFLSNLPNSESTNNICSEFRKLLKVETHLETILTAYIKEGSCESALSLVSTLSETLQVSAIKYLIFLVEGPQLYNCALGIYDFDLCIKIAQQIQRDPKEYLPQIKAFREMEEWRKKFEINQHLERFESALEFLMQGCMIEAVSKESCFQFIKKHSLYKLAIQSGKDPEYFKLFAENVKESAKKALLFELGNDLPQALKFYVRTANYTKAFELASRLDYSKQDLESLAYELKSNLEKTDYLAAALIVREYAHDIEESVSILLRHENWNEAKRICLLYSRNDLVETNVCPAIETCKVNLVEKLKEMEKEYKRLVDRLQIAKEIKKQRLFQEDDDIDMLSDTTRSTRSTRSSRSSRSSQSKKSKKNKKRKPRAKEGGRLEEEYLILTIKALIQEAYGLQSRVRDLLLVSFSAELVEKFEDLLVGVLGDLVFVFENRELDEGETLIEKPVIENIEWKPCYI